MTNEFLTGFKKEPRPLPYVPKVTIRVSCGRTRKVSEFAVELPVEGESIGALHASMEKLSEIFADFGIFATPALKEKINAKRNLRQEESRAKEG